MKSTTLDPITVRVYRDADEADVIDLLRSSLGEGPSGSRSAAYFRWKHIDNPFGRSFILLAEANGRPVGLRAFMRWQFTLDEAPISGVRAVDTATHPSYRRKGIFSRLTLEALESLRGEAAFVFNTPNEKSLPGYLKMGWEKVGSVPVYLRVVRPVSFLRSARSITSQAGRTEATVPRVEAAHAWIVLNEPGVEHLLGALRAAPGRFTTTRSLDYMRWRYGPASGLDYRAVTDGSGDGVNGMAIFRVRARGSLCEATVTDLLVAGGGAPTERSLLGAVRRAADVDHVIYQPSSAKRSGCSGFVRTRSGPTLVVNHLSTDLARDPRLLDSWALAIGDLEVL